MSSLKISATSMELKEDDVVIGEFRTAKNSFIKSLIQKYVGCCNEPKSLLAAADEVAAQVLHRGRFLRAGLAGHFYLASKDESLQHVLMCLRKASANSSLLRLAAGVRGTIITPHNFLPFHDIKGTVGAHSNEKSKATLVVPQTTRPGGCERSIGIVGIEESKYSQQLTCEDDQNYPTKVQMTTLAELEKPRFTRQVTPDEEVPELYRPTKNLGSIDSDAILLNNDLQDTSSENPFFAFVINKNDVLIGVPEAKYCAGNIKFQQYVRSIYECNPAKFPMEKSLTETAELIFNRVRLAEPSGRFLLREGQGREVEEIHPCEVLRHIVGELRMAGSVLCRPSFSAPNLHHRLLSRPNECIGGEDRASPLPSFPPQNNRQPCSGLLKPKRGYAPMADTCILAEKRKEKRRRKCVTFNPVVRVQVVPG